MDGMAIYKVLSCIKSLIFDVFKFPCPWIHHYLLAILCCFAATCNFSFTRLSCLCLYFSFYFQCRFHHYDTSDQLYVLYEYTWCQCPFQASCYKTHKSRQNMRVSGLLAVKHAIYRVWHHVQSRNWVECIILKISSMEECQVYFEPPCTVH